MSDKSDVAKQKGAEPKEKSSRERQIKELGEINGKLDLLLAEKPDAKQYALMAKELIEAKDLNEDLQKKLAKQEKRHVDEMNEIMEFKFKEFDELNTKLTTENLNLHMRIYELEQELEALGKTVPKPKGKEVQEAMIEKMQKLSCASDEKAARLAAEKAGESSKKTEVAPPKDQAPAVPTIFEQLSTPQAKGSVEEALVPGRRRVPAGAPVGRHGGCRSPAASRFARYRSPPNRSQSNSPMGRRAPKNSDPWSDLRHKELDEFIAKFDEHRGSGYGGGWARGAPGRRDGGYEREYRDSARGASGRRDGGYGGEYRDSARGAPSRRDGGYGGEFRDSARGAPSRRDEGYGGAYRDSARGASGRGDSARGSDSSRAFGRGGPVRGYSGGYGGYGGSPSRIRSSVRGPSERGSSPGYGGRYRGGAARGAPGCQELSFKEMARECPSSDSDRDFDLTIGSEDLPNWGFSGDYERPAIRLESKHGFSGGFGGPARRGRQTSPNPYKESAFGRPTERRSGGYGGGFGGSARGPSKRQLSPKAPRGGGFAGTTGGGFGASAKSSARKAEARGGFSGGFGGVSGGGFGAGRGGFGRTELSGDLKEAEARFKEAADQFRAMAHKPQGYASVAPVQAPKEEEDDGEW